MFYESWKIADRLYILFRAVEHKNIKIHHCTDYALLWPREIKNGIWKYVLRPVAVSIRRSGPGAIAADENLIKSTTNASVFFFYLQVSRLRVLRVSSTSGLTRLLPIIIIIIIISSRSAEERIVYVHLNSIFRSAVKKKNRSRHECNNKI